MTKPKTMMLYIKGIDGKGSTTDQAFSDVLSLRVKDGKVEFDFLAFPLDSSSAIGVDNYGYEELDLEQINGFIIRPAEDWMYQSGEEEA